jgi:hypothetical protein
VYPLTDKPAVLRACSFVSTKVLGFLSKTRKKKPAEAGFTQAKKRDAYA